jgi:flagellar hook-associated protein 3 FlgL
MLNNDVVQNIMRHTQNLDELNNKISTGKNIRQPSDNPGAATNQMFYRTRITELTQYKTNIEESLNRMNLTDSQLDRIGEIFQRVRYLTVQAANGIYQGDQNFELKEAIGREINQHLRALVDIANTRDATGIPLFGGFTAQRPPFEPVISNAPAESDVDLKAQFTDVLYRGDIGQQLREIENGEYMQVNIPGNKVFWGTNMNITSQTETGNWSAIGDQSFKIDGIEIKVAMGDTVDDVIDKINNAPLDIRAFKLGKNNISLTTITPHQIWLEDIEGGTVLKDLGLIDPEKSEPPNNYSSTATVDGLSIFRVLIDLRDHLIAGDQELIGGRDIQNVDIALQNVLRYRAEVGARTNRLELHRKRVEWDSSFMTELLAKSEDIDYPETIMNLKWLESVHNYALNVGAKIIQPTLMDYLR